MSALHSGQSHPSPAGDRRTFLKTTATTLTAAGLAATFPARSGLYAAGDDILRIGLVGCGGRGSGAAQNALAADKYTRLVAVADTFRGQIDGSLAALQRQEKIAAQVEVPEEQKFVGLDAYQHVIDNVDLVLLCTPPGFRPLHLRAAIEAGKHVFTEKPMATDAPGVRSVIESVRLSEQKGLGLCAGFCFRYNNARRALFQKLHDGAIGELLSVYGTYLTSPVKPMPPAESRPKGMSDLEWMVRNWYNFTWLSGDGLVEQAVHTVDLLAWAFQDQPPASCIAVGGRQIAAQGGNIFDHVEANYEWPEGPRGFIAQRQMAGCHSETALYIAGTQGVASITPQRQMTISGAENWVFSGEENNMYQTEHDEFLLSIRDGKPLNDGERMWRSTLLAMMGRMAAYTGQQVTWDQALNSTQVLVPEITDWDSPVPPQEMARPGIDKFS